MLYQIIQKETGLVHKTDLTKSALLKYLKGIDKNKFIIQCSNSKVPNPHIWFTCSLEEIKKKK